MESGQRWNRRRAVRTARVGRRPGGLPGPNHGHVRSSTHPDRRLEATASPFLDQIKPGAPAACRGRRRRPQAGRRSTGDRHVGARELTKSDGGTPPRARQKPSSGQQTDPRPRERLQRASRRDRLLQAVDRRAEPPNAVAHPGNLLGQVHGVFTLATELRHGRFQCRHPLCKRVSVRRAVPGGIAMCGPICASGRPSFGSLPHPVR